MRIDSVVIKNFRSLRDVEINFDNVTTFIGPNGTGKSTVLRALDWLFNGTKGGDLTSEDCSFGAESDSIEVRVTFKGLTTDDRQALGKYAPADASTFTVWKTRTPNGDETLSANAKGFPDFTPIKNATSAGEKKDRYRELRENRQELDLSAASTGPAVDAAMQRWEAEHLSLLEDVPEIQTNFFGFNSNSKMSGIFDYVLVTADLRANEEAQDSKASIIGRILERSVDRTAADDAIAEIVRRNQTEQQRVYRERFSEQLEKLTAALNTVVDSYTPGRTIAVEPTEIELKAPRTTFSVTVKDGINETAVDRQGHGFQRTLLISALQMLAQSGAAGEEGVICLAIEEPELFQHPIQAQTFAKVLRSLAEDEAKRVQVTYATHSPSFVEAQNFHQVRRMTRSTEEPPSVSIDSTTVGEVTSKLTGTIRVSSVRSQLAGTISNQLSAAVFSTKVLLVEGTTEAAVLYGIGDRDGVGSLEARGLSIVPVSGKMNIPLAHSILTSLGIPTYCLFDADAGFEARARGIGKNDGEVEEQRKNHIAANRKLLRYFGLPEEDFPAGVVSSSIAILEDHLESHLGANWPEWVDALDRLTAEAGVPIHKNSDAYRTVTVNAAGSVPLILQQILDTAK